MSNIHRLEVPGLFHLVELKARGGQTASSDSHSRLLAVASLHGSIYSHGIQLCGYNVLPNRVLLVLIPTRPDSLGPALLNAGRNSSRPLDRIQHRVLSFWDRGYSACPFTDDVSWRVLRYVDRAAIAVGADPLDARAPNSSAEHAGLVSHGLLTAPIQRLPNPVAWRAFIDWPEDGQFVQAMELCLRTGKPFGPTPFVERVEETCGCRVRSSCLRWPRLFDASTQMANLKRVPPFPASGESLTVPCHTSV